MCPSTETPDEQGAFAADVLRNLLLHINDENVEGRGPFLVSHGWTEGPVMYLVYKAPPSDITWGLVRDTRESNIEPSPWPGLDVAVRYYYLFDLYEGRVSASFRHPGNPDTILWHGDQSYGDPCEGLPQRTSDIPEAYRYTSPPIAVTPTRPNTDDPPEGEPRRYADPL
jgi:hypothetical protein